MSYADLIVPGSRNNKPSISFIVEHLKSRTKQIMKFKKIVKREIVYIADIMDMLGENFSSQITNSGESAM